MTKFIIALAVCTMTLGFAGSANAWEGAFKKASKIGQTWTASVFDYKRNRQIVKRFRTCRRTNAKEEARGFVGYMCR